MLGVGRVGVNLSASIISYHLSSIFAIKRGGGGLLDLRKKERRAWMKVLHLHQ